MKIAIVGGGASGMAAAYYLSKGGHLVTVFEKQSILGGHIRTINKNVKADHLNADLILEGGVIEFSSGFHTFLSLMNELDVELAPIKIGSAIFNRDGKRYLSQDMIHKNTRGFYRLVEALKLAFVYISATGLWFRTLFERSPEFRGKTMAHYVKENRIRNAWLKLLTMYCYSIPYQKVNQVPAELALSALRNYTWADWYRIKGGVYSYIEKILEHLNGEVILNANITGVTRSSGGVEVIFGDGKKEFFDKVVFAVPPDQVLKLLTDPTDHEKIYFGKWQENIAQTIVHTDTLLYQKYGITQPSEFDFFETTDGWGYNACLNQICGLTCETRYNLSFHLDDLIEKDKIVHQFEHHTPLYTLKAFRYRDQILASNGDQHTYHAGAYLYDGLHEGAILTGKHVAELIDMAAHNKQEPNVALAQTLADGCEIASRAIPKAALFK